MRSILLCLAATIVLFACADARPEQPPINRWSDEALWPVLEAQEHRDTDALCGLLASGEERVREAAALAFASVQDSASIPCLLKALRDDAAGLRSTAAFALGFIADSTALEEMAEWAMQERDSTVQRALMSASFIAMQRAGRLNGADAIVFYLQRNTGHERERAADALRRLPDSTLKSIGADYLALLDTISPGGTEASLASVLNKFDEGQARRLARRFAQPDMPTALRVNALRALTYFSEAKDQELFLSVTREGALGSVAVDALAVTYGLEREQIVSAQKAALDPLLALRIQALIPYYQDHGQDSLKALIHGSAMSDPSPYVRAAAILSNPGGYGVISLTEAFELMLDPSVHPVVRQAAFFSASQEQNAYHIRQYQQMIRPKERDHYMLRRSPLSEALRSGDAGLACAALEQLISGGGDPRSNVLTPELERSLRDTLRPLADLEALRLMDQLIAMRGDDPSAAPAPTPFTHAIDPLKLRALKQGQRYRIITAKGEIILTTDVDDCPGSSLAFDSLVVAGYYNGKPFHRMVPGFVLQGGCPRGDGYGGMPWALRTEIGRKLFTAGSVGLASAGRDTESCQFFITHSATPHLDGRYTRFGEVQSGMDVLWRLQVGDVMQEVLRVD